MAIKEANYVGLNNFQEHQNSFITVSLSQQDGPLYPKLCEIQGGAIHKWTECLTTVPMALVGCSLGESKSLAGRISEEENPERVSEPENSNGRVQAQVTVKRELSKVTVKRESNRVANLPEPIKSPAPALRVSVNK
ncbi:hypothetical protein CMV_015108 [Castanea mollissima]|uniref:Uncharacterized protein n=1 Tax=Castanea mollissima TaxID=60419 RepID=A0A8J4QV71_9ROSI|nr:hypothetical protein CMV_015108 [Castanea mollissima]